MAWGGMGMTRDEGGGRGWRGAGWERRGMRVVVADGVERDGNDYLAQDREPAIEGVVTAINAANRTGLKRAAVYKHQCALRLNGRPPDIHHKTLSKTSTIQCTPRQAAGGKAGRRKGRACTHSPRSARQKSPSLLVAGRMAQRM